MSEKLEEEWPSLVQAERFQEREGQNPGPWLRILESPWTTETRRNNPEYPRNSTHVQRLEKLAQQQPIEEVCVQLEEALDIGAKVLMFVNVHC